MNQPAKKLSILHLHAAFESGGKETRAIRLMAAWGDRAGHTILIGASHLDSARTKVPSGIDVTYPTDAPKLVGSVSYSRLRALATYMSRFDLVLSYNWGAMDGVMAHRLFARSMNLPPLVHHEDGFNADEADGLKWTRNLYRRIALQNASAIVVPSSLLTRVAICAWGQRADKVRTIPNGIDVDRYSRPPHLQAIAGFEKREGQIVIGTLAGLRPVKNLPLLVRAVAAMKSNAVLIIGGEGDAREQILQTAKEVGFSNFIMPGHIADPASIVGLFDVFALSSDSEQFPISLAEAMAAGLPAVCTDVGDVAAMVSPCNRPFIVPVGDAAALTHSFDRLAEDSALRTRIGASNRHKAVECFSEQAMIDAYAEIYGAALDDPTALLAPSRD